MSAATLPGTRVATRPLFALLAVFLLLAGVALASLSIGHESLSLARVLHGLAGIDSASAEHRIVHGLRLPRVLAAVAGGGALGVAGLLMQTLFRNPLADAWSLGLMAGGQFGAALVVVAGAVVGPAALQALGVFSSVGIVAGSALGTLGVALAMGAMARRVGTVTLLVLGLMLGFLAQGLIGVLLHFTNRTQSRIFASWNDATFASVVWPDFAIWAPPLLLGLALAVWLGKPLTALLLGDTYAASLGVDVARLRRRVLAATILLAAPVTAFCGPVAFVGLITPHLARGLLGSARIGALLPATFALGALLALVADLVVHLPWRQHFLHLNAILAILGAPVVIGLLLTARSLRAAERADMLALRGLAIGYGTRALAQLPDIDVRAGEFVCVLGRNGQGKSTLLRTLGGFLAPFEGTVALDGTLLRTLSPIERARRVAVVLTERPQLGALGVIELVEMGRQPHTGWVGALSAQDHRIAADALERVGGAHLAGRMVDSLSDGERQRVMIARALAQQPRLLLLDEITAFLDLPSRVTIIDLLRRIAREQGVAIVLSSHDLELSLETADRLWLLPGDGRFIEGAPEDVALSGAIGEAFDQHNLRFSLASGRFETPVGSGVAIHVDAMGHDAMWLSRALRRRGFALGAADSAVHRVARTATGWCVDGGPQLASIDDVLGALPHGEA